MKRLTEIINKKRSETKPTPPPTDAEKQSIELLHTLERSEEEAKQLYDKITRADDPGKYSREVESALTSGKRLSANLLKAYQKTVMSNDELRARWREISKKRKRKRFRIIPANAEIDLVEESSEHFARGINAYKMILICFAGSFFGVLIEMLWTLVNDGHIESRAGLVFGPFNLLYGIGAMALTVALYRFRNRGQWLSFLAGMLTGSAVEYVCSWAQELAFGSRSWDYSAKPFNLNGRICLLYGIYWGILGVFWIKVLYPWLAKHILKIPKRAGKAVSVVIVAFFFFNAVCTVIAIFAWSERINGTIPDGGFWEFIARCFPDRFMEMTFPNMVF